MLRLNIDPSSSEDSPSPEPPSKRPRLLEPTPPTPSSYRIYSWNCDDITPYLPPQKVSNPIHSYFARVSPPPKASTSKPSTSRWTIRSILKDRNWPELLCLQEVKILPTDKSLLARARVAASSDEDEGPEYTMYSTLPAIGKRATQNRRMYGVITYVRNDVATQITTARGVDWDDEGRVLILEMSGFAMINLYAVNGTDAQYIIRTTGETTGQTRHQRKRQFNHLLKRECLDLASRGYEICIVGDINISRTKIDSVPRLRSSENHVLARKEFNEQFLPETGLVDVWRRRHGEDARGFTWYMRGAKVGTDCARVDIILVSEGLYQRTREVEIEEWGGEACRSDHTLMWIQIDGMGQDKTSGDRKASRAALDVQGE